MPDRRRFLQSAGIAGAGLLVPGLSRALDLGPPDLPAGTLQSALLEALPGKRPLIKRAFRPPNYETPVGYFTEAFTPNDAFFVRYHIANIPVVDADAWRLSVGGEGAGTPFELTLAQLKADFEPVEIAALCMCSGNRRGLFMPHVAGIEWGHGAIGNARWKGVRLKDILNRAGVAKEAVEVGFDGADSAVLENGPDFRKSLPVWRALEDSVIVAWEMNGEPLPHWNGFPVRLVVPGWTATYWMKHLVSIQVLTKPLENFWMKPGYRIPRSRFPLVERFTSQETDSNTPITEMVVNSLVTAPQAGQQVRVGTDVEMRGMAWDGGYGIARVEVSSDDGQTWRAAELGRDHGRYSWQQWSFRFHPATAGRHTLMARATNRIGATQTFDLIANPAGYHHNVVQSVSIVAVA